MMKRTLLFLLLFSFAAAQFIDYTDTDLLPKMRHYEASDPDYYMRENVRYHMETELSIPSSQSYRWLSGSGSYNDIHNGDYVCEGTFSYAVAVNAQERVSGFVGKSHTYAYGSPSSWSTYSSGSNEYVYWSNTKYNNNYHDFGGESGQHLNNYGHRPVDFRELEGYPWYERRAEVSTIMKGTSDVKYWTTGGYSLMNILHSFSSLSGSQPSSSGTFTLSSSSLTDYAFTQNLHVTGAMIGYYVPAISKEFYHAFTELGTSQDEYSVTKSDDAIIHIYDEDHVGIIDPYILSIDMGADGPDSGPFTASPGEVIPVILTMYIPDRPDDFYPLSFEFYDVGVSPTGFSFSETSGINQCGAFFPHRNGGWFLPYHAYTSEIDGTLTVPSDLTSGVHQVQYRVHWRTCSNQEDCNGNGYDEWTDWFEINIYIPDDELPDLICEIEPIAYVDGIEPGLDGFAPGQGVEDWRVTITNVGVDEFEIPGVDTSLCSGLAFQAYSSNGIGAFSPFYSTFLTSSFPDSIGIDESITFDIEDGTAICVREAGGIRAEAWVNFLWYWYPYCVPFTPVESNFINNYCEWEAPCGELGDPEECTIIPSLVTNPDSEEVLTFDLFCDGSPCTGTVTWTTTPTGDPIGTMTASDQNGATVEVVTYPIDDVPEGSLLLEAAVASPNNMECEALIILELPPPLEECTIVPNNVNNPPSGSIEDFDLYCDGSPCTGTVTWDTFESGDHIGDMTASDQLGATVEIVTYTEPDELSGYMLLEATIDFPDNMICNATITLNDDGPGDEDDGCGLSCDIYPSPQHGAPGSYHEFFLRCEDDEDPDWYSCAGDWDIEEGDEYVLFTNPDYTSSPPDTHWLEVTLISNMVVENDGEEIEIIAYVDHGDDCTAKCYGAITLPPMDCFDYI